MFNLSTQLTNHESTDHKVSRDADDFAALALTFLTDETALLNLAAVALSDPVRLATLARESYRHDNGFLKLLLFRSQCDHLRVRLHIWPKTDVRRQNIHDHRFSFWSRIVRGRMINHVWEVGVGEIREHFQYYSRAGKSYYAMMKLGTTSLVETRQFCVAAGGSYFFESGCLHAIECPVETVTILVEDRRELRPFANVYRVPGEPQSETPAAPALSIAIYREYLEQIVRGEFA